MNISTKNKITIEITNTNRLKMWINTVKISEIKILKIISKKTLKYGEKCLLKMFIKILNLIKNIIESINMLSRIIETDCH